MLFTAASKADATDSDAEGDASWKTVLYEKDHQPSPIASTGTPLTPDNLIVRRGKGRHYECRACEHARYARRRAALGKPQQYTVAHAEGECPHGHKLEGDNIYLRPLVGGGVRAECYTCRREYEHARKERNRRKRAARRMQAAA